MTCKATYVKGSGGSSAELFTIGPQQVLENGDPEPTFTSVKRFGVELIRSFTTAESTQVKIECKIRYRDRTVDDNTYYVVQNCDHVLTFRDCDAPYFPIVDPLTHEDDCKDLESCYSSCDDKLKPFQYCGTNRLSFTEGVMSSDSQTTLDSALGISCCNTPSCTAVYDTSSIVCQNLGTSTDTSMARCEPSKAITTSLMSAIGTSTSSMIGLSAVGMMVVVLMTAGLVQYRRGRGTDTSDYYVPLL